MPPSMTVQVIVGLLIIFAVIVFLKIGSLRINGRPVLKLTTRILISLFFPLIFIIALVFGSAFLLVLIAFVIAVIVLAVVFSVLNKVKGIVK